MSGQLSQEDWELKPNTTIDINSFTIVIAQPAVRCVVRTSVGSCVAECRFKCRVHAISWSDDDALSLLQRARINHPTKPLQFVCITWTCTHFVKAKRHSCAVINDVTMTELDLAVYYYPSCCKTIASLQVLAPRKAITSEIEWKAAVIICSQPAREGWVL